MIVGNPNEFAVEFEVLLPIDSRWIYGTFCFWAEGVMVGDKVDDAVDLRGCLNWLRDFVQVKPNRFEPGLFDKAPAQIFNLLSTEIYYPHDELGGSVETSDSRFNISHLGMSAFDRTNLFVVENEYGDHRLIWTSPTEEILHSFVPRGLMDAVIRQTIEHMDVALGPHQTIL